MGPVMAPAACRTAYWIMRSGGRFGADLNAGDSNSNTLLKRALAHGEIEFGDLLTTHGATT